MDGDQNISSSTITSCNKDGREDEDDDVPLPGFRFHPTEEELVGFYLRRKVEKRPPSIELIKQIDIYKYDPWDLPKSSNVGDKEWYFFCKRGRKYRNSIRPNRVTGTGTGFWKATGIDRPIYATGGEERDCIGLKKSLVYYRGSAGKGTKTDWMMHEFRLPTPHDKSAKYFGTKTTVLIQEAEIWTLCRIFKRNASCRKSAADWRSESGPKRMIAPDYYNLKTYSSSSSISSSDNTRLPQSNYISFSNNTLSYVAQTTTNNTYHNITPVHFSSSSTTLSHQPPRVVAPACDITEFLRRGANWEDLRYVVDCAGTTVDAANSGNMFHS